MPVHWRIGLKLYSTDFDIIADARKLQNGFFDFVELYVVPDSYETTINAWKDFDIPFIIHMPHSLHGVNLAQAEKWQTNLIHFKETQKFSDELGSGIIIVHGGNNGNFNETIRQLALFKDRRVALENKPKMGLRGNVCAGWSPEEFRYALGSGIVSSMVLDFGHAACAANSLKKDHMDIVKEFMILNPELFHLSDGDVSSEKDTHLNLGKGNLNIAEFLSVIPDNGLVTIETPRDMRRGLDDFIEDIHVLRGLIEKA